MHARNHPKTQMKCFGAQQWRGRGRHLSKDPTSIVMFVTVVACNEPGQQLQRRGRQGRADHRQTNHPQKRSRGAGTGSRTGSHQLRTLLANCELLGRGPSSAVCRSCPSPSLIASPGKAHKLFCLGVHGCRVL